MVGCEPASLVGTDLADLLHADDRDRARRALTAGGAGASVRVLLRVRHVDGHQVPVEAAIAALRDGGQGGAVLSCRVVQAGDADGDEDGQVRNDPEWRFLSMAAHDLRSPLTTIIGFTDLLKTRWDSVEEDRRRDLLDRIARQAERMRRLVDDFLTTVQLRASALRPITETVDPVAVVREVLADLEPAVGRVRVDTGPGPLHVRADQRFLEQVVINLLTNASRYGRPPVTVTVQRESGTIALTVTDHGPGVPEQHVPDLFERFSPAAAGQRQDSTGLGLSIVRELVRAMGGEVHYEPNEPSGARFVVRLPAADGS